MSDPELSVMYYVSFLKTGKEKVKNYLPGLKKAKKSFH